MLELGPEAPAAHREIGRLAAGLGVERLIAIGGHATDLVDGAGPGVDATVAPDREAATAAAAAGCDPRTLRW